MSNEEHGSNHVSVGDLAAYLDGALSGPSLERVRTHLESCDACRQEVSTASGALLEDEGRSSPRTWAFVAAAAVIATLVLIPATSSLRSGPDEPVARSERGEGTPTFAIEAPRDGLTVASGPLEFRWAAPEDVSSYEFTLTNEAGDVVFSSRTQSASFSLPGTVELTEGRYYWVVDALLDRGREATTGVHEFIVAR